MGLVESIDQLLVLPHERNNKGESLLWRLTLEGEIVGMQVEISHMGKMRCYEIIYKGEGPINPLP